MIYLDHNATTAPAPEVIEEVGDALARAWANPSSVHEPGQGARRLLADARTRVARFLGCSGAELVFTSGATEANHAAVQGLLALQAAASGGTRRRLLVSAIEHPGLLALAERLAAQGTPVDRLPVDAQGRIDLAAAQALIGPDTALVCTMAANNETGVVQPLAAIGALVRAAGCAWHVDATQLAGRGALDFAALAAQGCSTLALSAHKLHGPKGVGALVVRKGLALPPLLSGRQERHRRGGTENTPGIAGFAAACDRAALTLQADVEHMLALRRRLEAGLATLPAVRVYGEEAERLPNTVCLRFGELPAELVLDRLERAGIVASSGAACTAAGTQPSHVLLAMGETPERAKGGVRFSLGRDTTDADISQTLAAIERVVRPLLVDEPATA